MEVVDGHTGQRLWLPVAADVALRAGHAGAGLGVEIYYNYTRISCSKLE